MKIEKSLLQENADHACGLLKCLAHPHRLMLICQLMDGPKSVGELAELVDIRQSTTSQHLSQLRLCDIVSSRREAQTVYYELASPAARALITVLHNQFCTAASPKPSTKKTSRKKTT